MWLEQEPPGPIEARIEAHPGLSSIDLAFPCLSSDHHNWGNVEAACTSWRLIITNSLQGTAFTKEIKIQVVRKIKAAEKGPRPREESTSSGGFLIPLLNV